MFESLEQVIYLTLSCTIYVFYTVKPVLRGHPKIDKTIVLMTNGSLMQVKSTVKPRYIATIGKGEFWRYNEFGDRSRSRFLSVTNVNVDTVRYACVIGEKKTVSKLSLRVFS